MLGTGIGACWVSRVRMNLAKSLTACAAAAVAGYCTYLIPHTIALEKIRRNVARYRLDKEVKLHKDIQQRINDVLTDLRIPQEVRQRIKTFSVFGYDPFNCGSLSTKYGVVLGVPGNFLFKDPSEIHKDDIKLFEMPLDWSKEEGKEFLKGMVLSERAQKAALAFTILKIAHDEPHYQAILAGVWAGNTASIYQFFKPSMEKRKFFALTLVAVSFTCWLYAKDYLARYVEKQCDEQVLELGPEYAAGMKEFVETTLRRNVAARVLMGKYGKSVFTENGDSRYWLFRSKSIPLSQRREFLASRLAGSFQSS